MGRDDEAGIKTVVPPRRQCGRAGYQANANDGNAAALGPSSTASGLWSVSGGYDSSASALQSTALGAPGRIT